MTVAILDIFLVTLALYLAIATKFGVQLTSYYLKEWALIWSVLAAISLLCNIFFRLYTSLWRYASTIELLYILSSGMVTGVLYFAVMNIINVKIAYSVYFLIMVYNTLFLEISRLGYRIVKVLTNDIPIGLKHE